MRHLNQNKFKTQTKRHTDITVKGFKETLF